MVVSVLAGCLLAVGVMEAVSVGGGLIVIVFDRSCVRREPELDRVLVPSLVNVDDRVIVTEGVAVSLPLAKLNDSESVTVPSSEKVRVRVGRRESESVGVGVGGGDTVRDSVSVGDSTVCVLSRVSETVSVTTCVWERDFVFSSVKLSLKVPVMLSESVSSSVCRDKVGVSDNVDETLMIIDALTVSVSVTVGEFVFSSLRELLIGRLKVPVSDSLTSFVSEAVIDVVVLTGGEFVKVAERVIGSGFDFDFVAELSSE